MSVVRTGFHALFGLFVDDGWLAVSTLGVVAATAVMRFLFPSEQMLAGATLLLGCFGVFVSSVLRGLSKPS